MTYHHRTMLHLPIDLIWIDLRMLLPNLMNMNSILNKTVVADPFLWPFGMGCSRKQNFAKKYFQKICMSNKIYSYPFIPCSFSKASQSVCLLSQSEVALVSVSNYNFFVFVKVYMAPKIKYLWVLLKNFEFWQMLNKSSLLLKNNRPYKQFCFSLKFPFCFFLRWCCNRKLLCGIFCCI